MLAVRRGGLGSGERLRAFLFALTFWALFEWLERPEPAEERVPGSSPGKVMLEAWEGGYRVESESWAGDDVLVDLWDP